jgi:SAM-dependent methyltransferase
MLWKLPGRRFEIYGRRLALRSRHVWAWSSQLFLNPVSSVRYFEFDFVDANIPDQDGLAILDVSSPALFGLYLSEKQECNYRYTNLDVREFAVISDQQEWAYIKKSYRTDKVDATSMPFASSSFDVVLSISVIEHIAENGDSQAILEMWRVLKTGGRLIFTVPASAEYLEEFRSSDTYQLGIEKTDEKYFFQRFYDEIAIENRVMKLLKNAKIQEFRVYGERKSGFFHRYEERWKKKGLRETVKDPYLMSRHMKEYLAVQELPGIGVAGFCLEKLGDE